MVIPSPLLSVFSRIRVQIFDSLNSYHKMNFEWDETKRLINQQKHGLDFVDAENAFKGDVVTIEDNRQAYGEVRFITMGMFNTRVVVIVHTERADTIRIISMRKASKHEERIYFKQIGY